MLCWLRIDFRRHIFSFVTSSVEVFRILVAIFISGILYLPFFSDQRELN